MHKKQCQQYLAAQQVIVCECALVDTAQRYNCCEGLMLVTSRTRAGQPPVTCCYCHASNIAPDNTAFKLRPARPRMSCALVVQLSPKPPRLHSRPFPPPFPLLLLLQTQRPQAVRRCTRSLTLRQSYQHCSAPTCCSCSSCTRRQVPT